MSHVISNGDSAILTGQFILIHCLEKLCLFQVKANELLWKGLTGAGHKIVPLI